LIYIHLNVSVLSTVEFYAKPFSYDEEVIKHRIEQGYSVDPTLCFRFPFRVSGYQHRLLLVNWFGASEPADPLVHIFLKVFGRAERVYAHGPKKMTNAFSGQVVFNGQKTYKWRYPGTVVGPA
jgi:hypothetical protein